MRKILGLSFALSVASVLVLDLARARAEEAPAAASIADLAWLEGHWRSGDPADDLFDEVWLPGAGGTMAAVSRLVHGGRLGMFELSSIEQGEGGLVLRIRHFGAGLAPWKSEGDAAPAWPLQKSAKNEVVFEDPKKDFPRRITYRREGDVLTARLEGTQGGKPKEMEFTLQRATP